MAEQSQRVHLHAEAVAWVARHLRARHCRVEALSDPGHHHGGLDLRVTVPGVVAPLTVAIRAARKHLRNHRVTVGGKLYAGYRYWERHYNLHVKGHRIPVRPDVWVLYDADEPQNTVIAPVAFVGDRITVAMYVGEGHHQAASIWRQWIGRWDCITSPARRAA